MHNDENDELCELEIDHFSIHDKIMKIQILFTKQIEIKVTNSNQSCNHAGGPKSVHSMINILADLPVQRNFRNKPIVDGEHNLV